MQKLNQNKISLLLKPLILSGIYKDEYSGLKDIILDFVIRKKRYYADQITDLENKYNLGFDEFTDQLQNKGTMEQEDDWMDWKAAIEMEKAWKIASKMFLENIYEA
jgi:hypothetical protein